MQTTAVRSQETRRHGQTEMNPGMCERECIYNEGANGQQTAGQNATDERRGNEGGTHAPDRGCGGKGVEEMQRVAKK